MFFGIFNNSNSNILIKIDVIGNYTSKIQKLGGTFQI